MRLWTYLLPAALWLWIVRRHGERVLLPAGTIAFNAGGLLVVDRPNPKEIENDLDRF